MTTAAAAARDSPPGLTQREASASVVASDSPLDGYPSAMTTVTAPTIDPTRTRLLRHMAWANATILARLADLDVWAYGDAEGLGA